ncbi:MAG: ABC transporter ATP-binding protein [Rhodobacteraceae bacterium]|nr:ABC transporter ATP-binding protein [Paracoccaceae bacterium]MCF8513523.1 ABC transporter ATP-binding protein [Paracoccaceae bacterium]MCF8517577.1 ABC transporter ATP-binding protein [Paracoccaceae bacterium]
MTADAILSTSGLTRDFHSFRAVDGVSLNIRPGSITGLIGPNGAGKTTLFNMIAGALRPSSGQVFLAGAEITGLPPEALFARGLARTFQIPRPFRRMTVLENVMLAPPAQVGETIIGALFRRRALQEEESRLRDKAMAILEFMTLAGLADQPAGKISGGQMKLLELARALMGDPKVILLDEPAAGVNPSLTRILIERIEELNRKGTTFVIVEHDMDFVMRHCDPVIALAEGRIVFEGTANEARVNPLLLDAYLGASA